MPRDDRYNQIKHSILNHHIETFNQIFDLIPKTVVAKDLHVSLDPKLKNIGKFRLGDHFNLATLARVKNIEILTLAAAQHEANKKTK
jgi:hypothetical protein